MKAFVGFMLGIALTSACFWFLRKEEQIITPEPNMTTGESRSFVEVMEETTGQRVFTFDEKLESHRAIWGIITKTIETTKNEMSVNTAPVRRLKRINEASKFFEDRLLELIDGEENFSCTVPLTISGKKQRSGYPDLRIEHLPSGTVAYLDPKLFEESSIRSSFRSFYYEPKKETRKVTEDALHFLVGFAHDGNDGAWKFTEAQLVDLSQINLKLKTEFSASNREIYGAAK